MSKILVVPDVHLKPWMFDIAAGAMACCDNAVVLGDLVDDFGCGEDADLYECTLDAAAAFSRRFPESLWCYGNHDWCYMHFEEGCYNSGFSEAMMHIARKLLEDFYGGLGGRAAVVHRVDATYFSHAGVTAPFVSYVSGRLKDDVSLAKAAEVANAMGTGWLWRDDSPLWARPEVYGKRPVEEGTFQVAGHTPVPEQEAVAGILLTDTFSTHWDGAPVGNRKLTIVDTVTGEWEAF